MSFRLGDVTIQCGDEPPVVITPDGWDSAVGAAIDADSTFQLSYANGKWSATLSPPIPHFDLRGYGPHLPDNIDRARWALATADLTPEQRAALTAVVDELERHECDW